MVSLLMEVELQVGVVESELGDQTGVGLGPQDVLRGKGRERFLALSLGCQKAFGGVSPVSTLALYTKLSVLEGQKGRRPW